MRRRRWAWLFLVVVLILLALLAAGDGGDAAPAPVEQEGVMWPVERGWLLRMLRPTADEPAEPAVGIMNPPHWACFDPTQC